MPSAADKTVLVVDDEAPIRRVIELKLKTRGYTVLLAPNGEEGLELIRTRRPDVVITDVMMPKLDGKAMCTMSDPLKAERPFLTIVMSCRVSPDEESWAAALHDTIFMEKPFSPSKLLECVDQYCGISHGQ